MTTMGATRTGQVQDGTLGQQLERIGWALFLIMIGGLALLPSGWVPAGAWLVGVGLIMVGMNVVRHLKGIRVSGFTTLLGVAAMAAGFFSMAGIDFPVFPILLIAVGAQILYSVLLPRKVTR
jgi:Na+/H+ antiporter NhaB